MKSQTVGAKRVFVISYGNRVGNRYRNEAGKILEDFWYFWSIKSTFCLGNPGFFLRQNDGNKIASFFAMTGQEQILRYTQNDGNKYTFSNHKTMKIISWNVNGIRAVEKKGELDKLVATYKPDILFLQEIKGSPDKFGLLLNHPDGYEAFYNPAEKPGYAGTGVWIAEHMRKYVHSIQTGFENDPTANEGRVIHLELQLSETPLARGVKGGSVSESTPPILDIFGIYFPNGGKSEQAWQDKLVFYAEFTKRMDELRALGHIVLWGGDLNCAHNEIDLARPKENDGNIGFHPLERAWLDGRTRDGWHDIWRTRNPDKIEVYSWWDVITRSRERNVGWRIDAWWGEAKAFAKTTNITYLTEQYGSDHCPIMVEME